MSSKKYDDVSVYFDKERNRYDIKVTIENGKKRKTVHGKTEEEAVLKARQLLYSTKDEDFMIYRGMPLIELVKYNFERRDEAGKIRDAQYNRTIYVIKQIENSKIGSKNVIDITEKEYQEFFNEIAKKYADSSLDKCYSEISQALKYAKRKKIIKENVLEDIIKPKSKISTKKIKALKIKEQKILTDYLLGLTVEDYEYKNVFLIQMYMGLRIGEVLTLKNNDIDLDRRTIHIQRTLTENRERKKSYR